jgi:hypothetical protein
MSRYTTRTDHAPDTGTVDLGFHYRLLEPCKFCDLVRDGIIRFDDFAKFANRWLDEGCNQANEWCKGADFTFDSKVDAFDLALFADCWLVQDTTAPVPNPPKWDVEPRMVSSTAATMSVEEVVDGWGWDVQYLFECVNGNCHDSQWQSKPSYTDTGLTPGMEYAYHVKARDLRPLHNNETKWSTVRHVGAGDRTPPAPAPRILSVVPDPNNPRSLVVTAQTAFDDSGVQYFFDVDDTNTPGGHDSGWIDTPTYTDPNLAPNTRYCYRVKARDLSASLNETGWSGWLCGTTGTGPDIIAPTPNPAQWDPNGLPREYNGFSGNNDYWVEMAATVATDNSGGPVQYYFWCVDKNGFSSGWINQPIYRVKVGPQGRGYRWRVQTRDAADNVTGWSELQPQMDRPNQPALGAGVTGNPTP